jgi:DNA repair exonuclease SbcCD ATPase subunit
MKRVILFEQFIAEAKGDAKRIKELKADLEDLNNQMEEIQDAMDNGDMDPDEAELQLSDLDGQKLEMEDELAELEKAKAGSGLTVQEEYTKVAKFTEKIDQEVFHLVGDLTHGWIKYNSQYGPKEEKEKWADSAKAKDAEAEQQRALIDKMIEKVQKQSEKYSDVVKGYLSEWVGPYLSASKGYSEAASWLNVANNCCQKFETGCNNIKELEAKYYEAKQKKDEAEVALKAKLQAVVDAVKAEKGK